MLHVDPPLQLGQALLQSLDGAEAAHHARRLAHLVEGRQPEDARVGDLLDAGNPAG
ncbi:MAG: hypothetical protein N2383_14140 [Caldilineales bacterium]|nr:hypothetical protein [Caldilineales bacterium]